MDKHFICLANSYKRGGRCIAGIEVSIDNDQWAVRCHSDGSPRWIRPIDRNTEYGEITEGAQVVRGQSASRNLLQYGLGYLS